MNRIGDWMQTFSGVQFWPIDPRTDEIHIADIAHSLANQCRFAGHCHEFYSVAEHSVRVSHAVPPEHALWGLLHDAAEAYLVDLPRPVKRYSELGSIYQGIEARLMACICQRFGLSVDPDPCIKLADNVLLMTEKRDLMGPSPAKWAEVAEPLPDRILPWSPWQARYRFINRYQEITSRKAMEASK